VPGTLFYHRYDPVTCSVETPESVVNLPLRRLGLGPGGRRRTGHAALPQGRQGGGRRDSADIRQPIAHAGRSLDVGLEPLVCRTIDYIYDRPSDEESSSQVAARAAEAPCAQQRQQRIQHEVNDLISLREGQLSNDVHWPVHDDEQADPVTDPYDVSES